jgi:hypothetical protein
MPGIALLPELSDYERMLQRGDQVPHFEVRTSGGELFRYASIWQHKNLLLVALPGDAPAGARDTLEQATPGDAFQQRESVCVVTRDGVPGLHAPAALVADRRPARLARLYRSAMPRVRG